MATYDGVLGAALNAHTADSIGSSVNVSQYAVDPDTNVWGLTTPEFVGSLTDNLPIEQNPEALDGVTSHNFIDKYYYRLWIISSAINLGRILSEQNHDVEAWNSFFESRDFGPIDITGNDDGMTLVGDASGAFVRLESKMYSLEVAVLGANSVDVTYDWDMVGDGDTASVLRVLGTRLAAFLLRHNWAVPILEQIGFKTNIIKGISGYEQRQKLRQSPRRRLEMSYLTLTSEERIYLENAMHNQNRVFAIPLWSDATLLGLAAAEGTDTFQIDTVNREFEVGGLVFLHYQDTSEILEIASFDDDSITTVEPSISAYPLGAKMCPAKFGVLERQQKVVRHTSTVDSAKLAWLLDNDTDRPNMLESYTPDTYLDLEVYSEGNDYSSEQDIDQETESDYVDNEIGLLEIIAGEPFPRRTYPFTKLMTRDELPAYLQWFYNRSGRYVPFFWVDRVRAFRMVEGTAFDSVTMTVQQLGYAEFMFANEARRHIAIENGTGWIYRTLIAADTNDDGTTTLTLDTAPGIELDHNDNPRICLLRKVRLDSDVLEVTWETSGVVQTATRFIDVF